MKILSTNHGTDGGLARSCSLCKVYWITTVRSAWHGRRSLIYREHTDFHASLESALDAAEVQRKPGAAFLLRELPALFFPCDYGGSRLSRTSGVVLVEVNTQQPLARFGAVSVLRLDRASLGELFASGGEDVMVFESGPDMPVLACAPRMWISSAVSRAHRLQWREVPKAAAWDLSHIESLRMRFDQQVRAMRLASKAAQGA